MASLKSDIVDKGGQATESFSIGSGDWGDITTTILLKFAKVLEGALVLLITWFVVRQLKKYFLKIETTHEQQKTALNFLEKITTGFVIVIGITLALKMVGLDMSLFVGVVLLGVSYGLKDIIKNYIAGILIFLKAPFKIGDVVKIKKYVGKVEHMELQSTTIKTFDNRDITIYNSDVMTKSIENYSRYPIRRMEIDVETGYGTNTEKAIKIFDKILASEEKVLKNPRYRIVFKEFAKTGLVFQMKFWVNTASDALGIKSSLAFKIHQAFDEKELITPYSKSYETTQAPDQTPDQVKRIQVFYSSPMFQTVEIPATPASSSEAPETTATGTPQLAPEYIDLDEPE